MNLLKIAVPALLALTVAACQTPPRGPVNVTQEVYGNVNPAVPDNWVSVVSQRGSIVYLCPIGECKDPGAIGYTVTEMRGDAENLVRDRVITAGLLAEIGRSLTNVTDGAFTSVSVRDLTNRDAAGFETANSVETAEGRFYSVSRFGINGNQVRTVTGVGKTLAKARHNMRVGIAGTR